MDNETKITNEQINSIKNDFDSSETKDIQSVTDILSKHLTSEQTKSLESFLHDKDKMESLLSSPFAKAILKKYMKNGE